jgi:hypothetical protein
MNSAEYVSVLVSIIIGLALADILVSLHRLVRARARVRWDWAAPLATLLVAMLLLMMWWSFYEPSITTPSIGDFLPNFVLLVFLFLLAGATLPDEVPPEGLSLRDYYDANGRYFWSLFAATLAWVLITEIVGGIVRGAETLPLLQSNLAEFAILAVFISLIFIRRRWWHAIAFVILASGPVGWVARSLG